MSPVGDVKLDSTGIRILCPAGGQVVETAGEDGCCTFEFIRAEICPPLFQTYIDEGLDPFTWFPSNFVFILGPTSVWLDGSDHACYHLSVPQVTERVLPPGARLGVVDSYVANNHFCGHPTCQNTCLHPGCPQNMPPVASSVLMNFTGIAIDFSQAGPCGNCQGVSNVSVVVPNTPFLNATCGWGDVPVSDICFVDSNNLCLLQQAWTNCFLGGTDDFNFSHYSAFIWFLGETNNKGFSVILDYFKPATLGSNGPFGVYQHYKTFTQVSDGASISVTDTGSLTIS